VGPGCGALRYPDLYPFFRYFSSRTRYRLATVSGILSGTRGCRISGDRNGGRGVKLTAFLVIGSLEDRMHQALDHAHDGAKDAEHQTHDGQNEQDRDNAHDQGHNPGEDERDV